MYKIIEFPGVDERCPMLRARTACSARRSELRALTSSGSAPGASEVKP